MKTGASLKNRQGGAVAVMVGISMVLLVGFLAMVIDLGHLYVAKTGLQNAAEAPGVGRGQGQPCRIIFHQGGNGAAQSANVVCADMEYAEYEHLRRCGGGTP